MKSGSKITLLRDKRGLTQEQLAGMLGISRASLSHYEKNRREPDYKTLMKIADVFKVSIDYLLDRSDDPQFVLQQEIKDFVDSLELSDDDILEKFVLTIDGKQLSPQEAKQFITFIRSKRGREFEDTC